MRLGVFTAERAASVGIREAPSHILLLVKVSPEGLPVEVIGLVLLVEDELGVRNEPVDDELIRLVHDEAFGEAAVKLGLVDNLILSDVLGLFLQNQLVFGLLQLAHLLVIGVELAHCVNVLIALLPILIEMPNSYIRVVLEVVVLLGSDRRIPDDLRIIQSHEIVLVLLLQVAKLLLLLLEVTEDLPALQLEDVEDFFDHLVFIEIILVVLIKRLALIEHVQVSLLLLGEDLVVGEVRRQQVEAILDCLEQVHHQEPVVTRLDVTWLRLLACFKVPALRNLHQLQPREIQVANDVVVRKVLLHLLDEADRVVLQLRVQVEHGVIAVNMVQWRVDMVQARVLSLCRRLQLHLLPLLDVGIKQHVVPQLELLELQGARAAKTSQFIKLLGFQVRGLQIQIANILVRLQELDDHDYLFV